MHYDDKGSFSIYICIKDVEEVQNIFCKLHIEDLEIVLTFDSLIYKTRSLNSYMAFFMNFGKCVCGENTQL